MAEIETPAGGKLSKKQWYILIGGAGAFVGYRWWKARNSASTAATTASGTPIGLDANGNPVYLNSAGQEVDASGNPDSVVSTSGGAGSTGYTNPAPISGTTSSATGTAPTTDEQWTAAVVQDLENLGYDPQTVATAIAEYLSSQPLTSAQVTIIRTAWSYEGRPPGEPNLPIIQSTSTGTTGGGGGGGTGGTGGGGTTLQGGNPPSGGGSTKTTTSSTTYKSVTVVPWPAQDSTYSGIASHYKYAAGGNALWEFQYSPTALAHGRSAAAAAELRAQGPNLLHTGQTVLVPITS